MKNLIKKRIIKAIKEKVFPGCVVGVVWKTGKRLVLPFGNFTYEKGSPKIKEDSIFDVASITKSIPTSSLALKLIDQGKLNLNDKVADFIPEFKNKDGVLIKHLLTQTLNLSFNNKPLKLSEYRDKAADEILNIIFRSELNSETETIYGYNNVTSIILGLIVEKLAKSDLARLAEEYFFKPLKMKRTAFRPLEKFAKNEIVPTEIDNWRKRIIQGEVHDESAYVLHKKMTPGSAGLFSTVPDLLIFLEMILNNGKLNGKKYFSKEIIEQMYMNQVNNLSLQSRFGNEATNRDWKAKIGLGWELNQSWYMGKFHSTKIIGKTGFTGCVVICDMKKEIGIVILSNYTYPKRKPNSKQINGLRRDIANIIFTLLSSFPHYKI